MKDSSMTAAERRAAATAHDDALRKPGYALHPEHRPATAGEARDDDRRPATEAQRTADANTAAADKATEAEAEHAAAVAAAKEAQATADAAQAEADKAKAAAAEAAMKVAPKADAGLKLFRVSAHDKQAPPFHYSNVAHSYIVAAHDEKEARAHAAATAPAYGDVYVDDMQTTCIPLVLSQPGVIGSEVTV